FEGAEKTAIGWGLIAEAYANFGYLGVIGVGLAFGLLSGVFERWSNGAQIISLPTLSAIVAMMQLINLEADLAGLVTALWQSLGTAWIFFGLFKFLLNQRNPLPRRINRPLTTDRLTVD